MIFLTDGLPTVGETNEGKIVEAVKAGNAVRARLMAFGVGYDVNSRLLDRITRENFGRSEFVRANEDIELYVSRLYQKISSPVMTDVAVRFEFDAVPVEQGEPVNRLYPRQVGDLFEGEQLVLVGRYKKSGPAKVKITGRVAGQERKFDFPATLVESSADQSCAFVEKLWAMRRIGEIIDELDLRGKNDELIQELVQLSTKHGILTPYTSFLADENAAPGSLAGGEASTRRAAMLLDRLHEADGKAAFAQRAEKKQLLHAERPLAASAAGGAAARHAPRHRQGRSGRGQRGADGRRQSALPPRQHLVLVRRRPGRRPAGRQGQGDRAVQRGVLPPGPGNDAREPEDPGRPTGPGGSDHPSRFGRLSGQVTPAPPLRRKTVSTVREITVRSPVSGTVVSCRYRVQSGTGG